MHLELKENIESDSALSVAFIMNMNTQNEIWPQCRIGGVRDTFRLKYHKDHNYHNGHIYLGYVTITIMSHTLSFLQ